MERLHKKPFVQKVVGEPFTFCNEQTQASHIKRPE